MGSLFRSAEMTLCQLFLQSEAAYACVSELGELGLVQFRDLNPDVNAFQRKFVNEVRRCDEMERKLRYLEKEIKKDGIPMLDTGENPEAPQPREMIDLEATFEKLENELREVNQNAEALKRNFLELTELKQILRKTQVFFDEHNMRFYVADVTTSERTTLRQDQKILIFSVFSKINLNVRKNLTTDHEGGVNPTESMTRALISDDSIARQSALGPVQLGFPEKQYDSEEYMPCFVAGVILRERIPAFERMLWRACRGNVFLRQAEIETPLEDPASGDQAYKSVFIIFFQGDQLKIRVKKICEGFRATLYPCPDAPADRREMAMGVMTRIEDLNTVLGQTQDHRHRVLVAAAKNIKNWFVKVRKIKAIYHTLNLFNLDVTQKCLIAECWVPVLDLENIQLALRRGTERSGSSVPPILNRMDTAEDPPTYNHTNKFTSGFQTLIDAYGIASYREMNPTPYTIITFPFLFAVMFGDLGHGLLMAVFGAWMVFKEKPLAAKKSDNEIWNIFFGGRYIILLMGCFSMYTGFIFCRYFKDKLSTLAEFIPQIIFLVFLFFYMVILMFIKWFLYYANEVDTDEAFRLGTRCAPNVLITFINMILQKETPFEPRCGTYNMYSGQLGFQKFLFACAMFCVPWMLLAKPIVIMRERKRTQQYSVTHQQMQSATENGDAEQPMHNNTSQPPAMGGGGHGEHEEEPMSEIFIHQAIHTIEYVLGSVSHTASYLRLWALSLAHSQLSEVLWIMVLSKGLKVDGWAGGVALYVIFAFWAVLTVSILVLMEGLSAFLHTLRLHWVEFQSKFYKGTGYGFQPFSFEIILDSASQAKEEV
uniref:V-type proton ATPase subunit a n=1 Tax=Diabrotica virgifera virgifera TaxID=50390 RepID=A0A6P7H6E1_DIAVI